MIPSRSNAKSLRDTDWSQYKNRNLVERFWSKAKPYRWVATHYEKKAQNFLAFVHLASIMILLQWPKYPAFTKPCPHGLAFLDSASFETANEFFLHRLLLLL